MKKGKGQVEVKSGQPDGFAASRGRVGGLPRNVKRPSLAKVVRKNRGTIGEDNSQADSEIEAEWNHELAELRQNDGSLRAVQNVHCT